jgi:hypothetical protein
MDGNASTNHANPLPISTTIILCSIRIRMGGLSLSASILSFALPRHRIGDQICPATAKGRLRLRSLDCRFPLHCYSSLGCVFFLLRDEIGSDSKQR